MGLLNEQKTEREKYINVKDFINLIAFTKKEMVSDVASYLVIKDFEQSIESYLIDVHGRINKTDSYELHGFDIKTKAFLDNCWESCIFDDYVIHRNSKGMETNFYYSKVELSSLDFIKNLDIDFSLEKEVKKAVNEWRKESENLIYRNSKADFNNPNMHQLRLFKQSDFTTMDAACLLAGVEVDNVERFKNNNRFTELYSDYIAYKLMLDTALVNKSIEHCDLKVSAADLQYYLFKTGYVIKGFNDWLAIEPAKPLKEIKQDVELGEHQKSLITYDAFTPDQIICLIINYDPSYVVRDAKYLSYWNLVNDAVDANQLLPFDQQMNIPAEQVKTWLASNGYIYKDFNDKTPIEQSETIRKLTEQLAAAHAAIKQLTDERDEAASLENKLVEKVELANNDLEQVHPRSLKTIDRVMYAMAEIIDINNTKPYGKNKGSLNDAILTVLEKDSLDLGPEAIGNWLSRVNALKSVDKINREIERFKE